MTRSGMIQLPIIHHPIASYKTANGNVFVLMSGRYNCRWLGDTLDYSVMEVHHNGTHVATLFDGSAYGWGRIHGSLSPIRGCGFGLGNNFHDHNTHDTGPTSDLGFALALVAFRAEYIMLKRAGKQAA